MSGTNKIKTGKVDASSYVFKKKTLDTNPEPGTVELAPDADGVLHTRDEHGNVNKLLKGDIGGTASDDNKITIPKNTTAGLDALTNTEATIAYNTDDESLVVNTGTEWKSVGGGEGALSSYEYGEDLTAGDVVELYEDGGTSKVKKLDKNIGTPINTEIATLGVWNESLVCVHYDNTLDKYFISTGTFVSYGTLKNGSYLGEGILNVSNVYKIISLANGKILTISSISRDANMYEQNTKGELILVDSANLGTGSVYDVTAIDTGTGKVIVVYNDFTMYGAVLSYTDTSLSYGSTTYIASSGVYRSSLNMVYFSTQDVYAVAYQSSSSIYMTILSISGTSIVKGNTSYITYIADGPSSVVYDVVNDQAIVTGAFSSNFAYAIVTCNGTSLAVGASSTVYVDAYQYGLSVAVREDKLVVFYSNSSRHLRGATFTLGNGTISYDSNQVNLFSGYPMNSDKFKNIDAVYSENEDVFLTVVNGYSNSSESSYTLVSSIQSGNVSTQYNPISYDLSKIIGIVQSDGSTSSIHDVATFGQISTVHSSKIIGTKAYLTKYGNLSDNIEESERVLGTYIATTKLFLNGEGFNISSPDILTLQKSLMLEMSCTDTVNPENFSTAYTKIGKVGSFTFNDSNSGVYFYGEYTPFVGFIYIEFISPNTLTFNSQFAGSSVNSQTRSGIGYMLLNYYSYPGASNIKLFSFSSIPSSVTSLTIRVYKLDLGIL